MHKCVMKNYGGYLKEHYMDLEHMSTKDLCDARQIAETMKEMLKADKEYNIIKSMEENGNNEDVEMMWDEFVIRFKKMYEESDTSEKIVMKREIENIIS